MFEDIQKHRQAVRENIEKSLQIGFTESEDFEKAHQVGDIHPNGKWVWTQLPSGKYDWRVIKKQSQSTVPSQQNVNKQQKTEDGLTKEELEELRALESAARKGYKLLQRDANRLRRLQAKERELKQEKLMATQSKKTEEKKGKAANLGEYYSSTLRGPKDVEEFFSDIRKKKISFDVLGMKRSDGTYDKVGRITGGKLGSQYDSYAVQVNIRWYGNSSNEKRQFASIADFKKFLVNVG